MWHRGIGQLYESTCSSISYTTAVCTTRCSQVMTNTFTDTAQAPVSGPQHDKAHQCAARPISCFREEANLVVQLHTVAKVVLQDVSNRWNAGGSSHQQHPVNILPLQRCLLQHLHECSTHECSLHVTQLSLPQRLPCAKLMRECCFRRSTAYSARVVSRRAYRPSNEHL